MNDNKKNSNMNSGWILCPSKTFPGKLYYFNVLNGETAWSIGDAEKKTFKKDGISKVTGLHHHPEPTSPPTADSISNTVNSLPSFSLRHPATIFGQSMFPKTVPSKWDEPNVIWTPVQIQVPIVLQAPESRTQVTQMTQAMAKESQSQKVNKPSIQFAKDMFVHACNKPLSQRFMNYEKPVIDFDKNNKIKDKKQFEKFYTSTAIKKNVKISEPSFKAFASNTNLLFQSKSNLSFSDLMPKTSQQKQLIKQSVFNVELPSKTQNVFNTHDNLKQIEPNVDENQAGIATASSTNILDSDLRMLLLAKRKSSDIEAKSSAGEMRSKNVKIHTSTPQPKKRVTFNLDCEDISRIDEDDDYVEFVEKYSGTVQSLKNLAAAGMRCDLWYIIVDAEVLLEEFSFLDSFVRIDPYCKLVIPPSVHAAVCAMSRGVCGSRTRVITARHLVRKLPNAYTIVQSADDEGMNSPANDAILKSCVEAMDQNIHVILVTNETELLRTAKCYPIHCFNVQNIKTGLAPKPNAGYKHMKITIRNDTEPNFTQNGSAINKQNTFDEYEDLNDKEKEILRYFKQVNSNGSLSILNENSMISKENFSIPKISSVENPKLSITSNKSLLIPNDYSRISKQSSMLSNTNSSTMVNSNGNSNISNMNSVITIDHSTITNSTNIPSILTKNSRKCDENSTVCNSKATTEWRYAASDITETTIEVDLQNLNLKEKTLNIQKVPEITNLENQKTNKTVSLFFQKPTPKFDFQKFKTPFQNGGEKTFVFGGKQKPTANNPIFETNKTKEPRSVFEMGKEKTNSSIFENDVFKNPQSVSGTKTNTVDLSKFYVKNKIIENRLNERMDEWVCLFKQIMEESLTDVMEKLPAAVLKYMAPPWSLYEALQCYKTVYKDHKMVISIVDELCGYIFENDYRPDKLKKNITPNDFIKGFGCGVLLIKYLKNIRQHSTNLLDAEESLLNMLKQIENPVSDINEPLVRTPAEAKTDEKEIRQNFIKNRSEIVNYLKKHYTEWQNYTESDDKVKIVRTFGRDLNQLKLDKKVGNKDVVNVTSYVGVATKNVDATKGGDNAKDVDALERTKAEATFDTATRNVDNVVEHNELKKKKMKQMQIKTDFKKSEIVETSHTPKTDNGLNSKEKPKIISIFDFVKPKDTKKYIENQKDSKNNQNGKFKIDSNMLGVKITVPNDYKLHEKDDKFDNKNLLKTTDNINEEYSKKNDKIEVTPLKNAFNKKDLKIQEHDKADAICSKVIEKRNEIGPKIVRNVHLIEEFEKRFITRESMDLDELDYDPENPLDSIYYDNDNLESINKNYISKQNYINEHSEENKSDNLKNMTKNYTNISDNVKVIETNDPKKDDSRNDRKSDKDDMTNDSGLGNESPHVYSVVKSFSSELCGSLDIIRTLVDGSLQEYREGQLRDKTKKMFRLKAFEANFIITKIINRLNKLVEKETVQQNEVSNEKLYSKNTEALMKCLEQAQILQITLNMMLSETNENRLLADLNSSMSLNLSS